MGGKYLRRAIEVEAWQFDDAGPAMPIWLIDITERLPMGVLRIWTSAPDKDGIRKFITADLGDWVLLHADGHVATLDPDSFADEFEAVR